MDEADRAQEVTEQALKIALGQQDRKARMPEKGKCYWCDEAITTGLFCDEDCRDDFEQHQRFKGIRQERY
jgi:hypothetical protein